MLGTGFSLFKNKITKFSLFLLISISSNIVYSQTTESFTNIPASASTYANRSWTGNNGGTWTATNARTDQTITSQAICFQGSTGKVTSNSVAGGCGILTFKHKIPFAETSPTFTVWVNGVQQGGTITPTSAAQTANITVNVSGSIVVEIRAGGSIRLVIDDISWTAYSATTPTITATPTSLTGFTYGQGSGPSTTQTFSVSGINLTSNITLTAPTNYEISFASGSGFGATLTLNQTSGTVGATTIYVRLKAGLLAGNYNSENIVCTSTSAPNVNVSCSGTVTAPVPVIVLNSSNPSLAAGNIIQNTTSNVIYAFSLNTTVANASLTALTFTTVYAGTNVTNLRLQYSTDNVFTSGSEAILKTIASPGASGSETFSAITHTLTSGTTGYYFITADVSCMTVGTTISVNALTTANLTFASGNKSGTAYASANQTITSSTPSVATALTTTNCQNTGSTFSWTDPAFCWDEVVVFVKAGAFSASSPTGNGSAYTANTVFGSGTAFDGGFCVYKGTANTVSITGLTMGTNYTFKIFTRNGSVWSTGATVNCTPTLGYCTAASTNTGFEFIQSILLTSLNSTTTNTTANTTYSDFTSISSTVNQGETFSLVVYNGDYFSSDIIKVWIDYNQNGDFLDAGESVFTSVAGAPAPYNISITVPGAAMTGSTRMRIRMYDSSAGTSNSTPCGTHTYGEVEDYTLIIAVPCVPTHSLSSFAPISGPVGTYVTINGTGFTNTSSVQFDGVLATSVTFVSSTKLIARVPVGATTGRIKINQGGCFVFSTSDFTLIEESGTCLTSDPLGFTDLFISEVYDSDAGNVAYIELFNPTNSPINLATLNYTIGIDNQSSAGGAISIDRTIVLTGIIPANSVFLLNLGTSANTCTKDWGFTAGGNGFNEFDNIILIKNGVQVDRVNAPNNTGYTMKRNITATAPTMTFTAADWTLINVEDCADLGVGPIGTFANPLVVLTNLTGCKLDMTVVTTEGDATPTGDVTYKWFYNNGISATWTEITASIPAGFTITGETTNNLEITSGTSYITDLDEYQFYCEVTEAGTCKNVSTASQYITVEKPVYRSIAASNGNWTTVANWEMAYTTAGPWTPACNYPRSLNSSQAIIQTGTTIVLDIDNDIDKLTIDGTLEVPANSMLTVYDSTVGADLILNGTLLYRANAANSMVLTNTTTWIFNSGAQFIKTNTADVFMFRDKYQGGMSTIPALGKFIYRYNGDGNPYSGAPNFYYPDLYFENTANAGNFPFNSSQMAFNGGADGFCTVYGNTFVGTTGTGSVTMYNNNINTNPMLIHGDLTVALNSSFMTDLCGTCGTASATINHGTGVELRGDLTVNGTLQILNGTTERVLRFTGSDLQQVSGTGTITLYKVTTDKVANYVNLNRNLTARNELKMVQGHIYTNTNYMELGYNLGQLGILTYTNGYVVGRMRRWFLNTNNTDITGLFPMGFDEGGLKNRFARVYFTTAPSAGGHLTVEFIPINMGTAGMVIPQVNTGGFAYDVYNTEDQGYWKIDNEPTKLVDGAYRIACTGEGFTPIASLDQLTLLKRVGTGDWFCPGTHVAATGTIAMPTCIRTGVSNWSNFGFGFPTNALPVELLDFNVTCDESATKIEWSTASERDNDYFELAYSLDGYDFTSLIKIDGAGNKVTASTYSYSIENLSSAYIKLSQIDFDGKQEELAIKYSNCSSDLTQIFPNPTKGIINIQTKEFEKFELTNQLGQLLTNGTITPVMDLSGYNQGIYFLILKTNSKSKVIKIEVVK